MRSRVLFMSRWPPCWWKGLSDGARDAGRLLRLPHLPHDRASELVRVVVRWDSHVHHIGRDEPDLRVLRRVVGLEDHGGLTAGRRVGGVRVDHHEVEEVDADVLTDYAQ